jgi:hypothetical protein
MGEKIGRGIEPNIVVHMKVAFDVPADYQCTTILALDFPPRFVKEMFKFPVNPNHPCPFEHSMSHFFHHRHSSASWGKKTVAMSHVTVTWKPFDVCLLNPTNSLSALSAQTCS